MVMSFHQFHIYLLCAVLFLVSCGEKDTINPARLGEEFTELPGAHLRVSHCPESQLFEQSKPYFQSIHATIHEAVRITGLATTSPDSSDSTWATPLNPIVISWEKLEQEHLALKNAIKEATAHESLELMAKSLSQKVNRWQYFLCRGSFLPSSRHSDSRYYLRSREKANLGDAIAMCEAFAPSVYCHAQAQIQGRQGKAENFLERWREMFEKHRYQKLFELKENSPKLSCRALDATHFEIELPFLNNADFKSMVGTLADLENAIEYWNSGRIKFKPVLTSENGQGVVVLEDSQGGLSHVSDLRPWTIVLQGNLPFDQRLKVMAHELGHVLGFPDCYNEFVDSKTGELIYFELDQERKNLMCSIERGDTIPVSYIEQIIERSCL